jgi:LPXTG-motif cell wall-anchored protein
MKRRYLIPLVASAAVIAIPGVAHAHTFNHTVGCGGLSWSATLYNAQETNTIVVTIDGVPVYTDTNFGTTDTGSRTWTQTVDHTWSIVVNAPGTTFDHNRSGRQAACQPPTTTTTTTAVTTTTNTPTTTTIPAVTTTSPPTTDTAPTTTTATDQSSTTTIAPPPPSSVPPSTSIPNPTDPTVPPTTPPTVARALPETGTASDLMFGVALGLFLAGCAAMGFARRRT